MARRDITKTGGFLLNKRRKGILYIYRSKYLQKVNFSKYLKQFLG